MGNSGVFPIDTVLYSFEIKSKLTLPELRKSDENAKRLLALRLMRNGAPFVIPGLIAFGTNLKGNGSTELSRYLKLMQDEDKTGIFGLRMLCVAKRGYWFFDGRGSNGPAWAEGELSKEACPGFALLDVVSSVINGYEQQRVGRVTDLNSYLINTGVSVCGHQGLTLDETSI